MPTTCGSDLIISSTRQQYEIRIGNSQDLPRFSSLKLTALEVMFLEIFDRFWAGSTASTPIRNGPSERRTGGKRQWDRLKVSQQSLRGPVRAFSRSPTSLLAAPSVHCLVSVSVQPLQHPSV